MPDGLPYATADRCVDVSNWGVEGGSIRRPLSDHLPEWDSSQQIGIARDVSLDCVSFLEQTGLPRGVRVGVTVILASDVETSVPPVLLDTSQARSTATIRAQLDGSRLGSSVVISSSLVLLENRSETTEPIAWRRGSRLWGDSRTVRLSGTASQFPVHVVDFSYEHSGLRARAPWFLMIGDELNAPAMGAIRLLINSKFPLVVDAVRMRGDEALGSAVRTVLRADVGRILAEHALRHDDLNGSEEDTLGSVLEAAIGRFEHSRADLEQMRSAEPETWSAELASVFGLLAESK